MTARQFLYLTNQSLTIYGPGLDVLASFEHGAEGHEGAFASFIKHGTAPLCLVTDVIEEDFRLDTIPHVSSRDRQELVKRKLAHLFHGTTHYHAEHQGRESEGRRDDRVLLSALTNEELVLPWLKAIAQQKRPLQGIWSVPLLSPLLIKKLGAADPHLLLINYQAQAGMRQSYFQGDQLKFSRLTRQAEENEAATHLQEECRRTRQYLESLRLLPRDQTLKVRVICCGPLLTQLRDAALALPLLDFEFLPTDDAAKATGLNSLPKTSGSEAIFLHLLATARSLPNQYATASEQWFYRLWQAKLSTYAASALLAVTALTFSASNLFNAVNDYRDTQQLNSETELLRTRYDAIRKEFPATPVPPDNMRAVVDAQRSMEKASPGLTPLMAEISRVLERYPQIRVVSYDWNIRQTPSPTEGEPPATEAAPPPTAQDSEQVSAQAASQLISAALRKETYQEAVFSGEVLPFQGYRPTQNTVQAFMKELGRTPGLTVSAEKMPLNESPKEQLSGDAGKAEQPDKLGFVLKITYKAPAP